MTTRTQAQAQHEAYARETATHAILVDTVTDASCYFRKNGEGEWEGILRYNRNDDWCTDVMVDQDTLDRMVEL